MKKAVTESPLRLLISILIITFIVSIGYFEINTFIENRDRQVFISDVSNLVSSLEYLISSNSLGTFMQVMIHLPKNQTVNFNNASDKLVISGFYNNEYELNTDVINNLTLNKSGDYRITLCYDCSAEKEYLVVFR
ncbi:Uncharacterised protein [Candidatus Tiddalikarchaeum anstoanum]|nr:Uncharacterised protein [Candidatus Tiddalikarchaeum anstoanum]